MARKKNAATREPGEAFKERFQEQVQEQVQGQVQEPFGDVAAVCGKDGEGLHVLRRRSPDGPLEAGVVRPLVEGKPISGEVISLRRRDDLPFLFDVTTEVAAAPATSNKPATGPSQVATESYRRGWEAIWGHDPRTRALN